jgi:hypothetical protein
MAGKAIDKMADTDASPNDQASRKKRLLKGPEEFQRLERIAQNEWSHPRKMGSTVEANSFLCVSAFPSFAFSVDKAIFGIALSIKRSRKSDKLSLSGKGSARRKRPMKWSLSAIWRPSC